MQSPQVVASTLLSAVRTDNPLVDAMLTSLVFGLVTYLMAHASTLWTWAVREAAAVFFRKRSSAAPSSRVTVPRVKRVNTGGGGASLRDWTEMDNDQFTYLTWFVGKHAPVARGAAVATGRAGVLVVLPERGQRSSFAFEGHVVSFKYMYEIVKSDKDVPALTDERLEVTVDLEEGVQLLVRLLEAAKKDYTASMADVVWKQTLHRQVVKKDTGAVYFNPSLTHSTKSFDTVVLDDGHKSDLVADLAGFMTGEAWYAKMGLSYKRGYLLHGPPGTGKTSVILAISNMVKANIYSINLSTILDDSMLDKAFEQIPQRSVVVFEDIDCMGTVAYARDRVRADLGPPAPTGAAVATVSKKNPSTATKTSSAADGDGGTGDGDNNNNRLTLSCLLNHIDGIGGNHGRVFVLTTNHPERLDPALVRPGRIDISLRLGMCTGQQLARFFELYYPDVARPGAFSELPTGVLSPAEVSATMLKFRQDPDRAIASLFSFGMAASPPPERK